MWSVWLGILRLAQNFGDGLWASIAQVLYVLVKFSDVVVDTDAPIANQLLEFH
jgi:hypothetical protein